MRLFLWYANISSKTSRFGGGGQEQAMCYSSKSQ